MSSFRESLAYYSVKAFAAIVNLLPLGLALKTGRLIGLVGYYADTRHSFLAYTNLKTAFANEKSSEEIKAITKMVFKNFGQNVVEVMRLSNFDPETFSKYVTIDGRDNVARALEKGKGLILLAMHFGSWELSSIACASLNAPYKVVVNPQNRYTKLDELLNSYRSCAGSKVLSRHTGIREIVKSLMRNEIMGMVVDQGGRDGELVQFFTKQASMFVGAIRLSLRFGVPICFGIIMRQKEGHHKVVIQKEFDLVRVGDEAENVSTNLLQIAKLMESYIRQYPAEYMWFYRIWKFSKQTTILILSDGKTGHLRQSEAVAAALQQALKEKQMEPSLQTVTFQYKSLFGRAIVALLSRLPFALFRSGHLNFLKRYLTKESFNQLMLLKADFIISCGSSAAALNYFLSRDHRAKSVSVLKPGIVGLKKFDTVVLPQHDRPSRILPGQKIVITKGAPNLMDRVYLDKQEEAFLKRFSHLKTKQRTMIGVLIGGDNKNYSLTEHAVKIASSQIKEAAEQINADIILTTSRRTSVKIENLIQREFKKDPHCPLLIIANRNNVPEAVGGILAVCEILIVSGDSISMVSEAASSGKNVIVFPVKRRGAGITPLKHDLFIEKLNEQGYIVSSKVENLGSAVHNIAKNKMRTRMLNDQPAILNAMREIV